MNILIAILAGLVGAAVGVGVGAGAGSVLAGVLKVPSREGAAGYFVVGIALLCGIVGFIAGSILGLRWRGVTNLAFLGGGSALSGLIVIGLVAAGIAAYYFTAELPIEATRLVYQIRLPHGVPPPNERFDIEMHTPKYRPAGYLGDWKQVDGRFIAEGEVDLTSKTRSRILALRFPTGEDRLFNVKFPRDPGSGYKQWTEWTRADHIYKRGDESPKLPPSDDPIEVRLRIRQFGDDEP